jgi:hypothetical protein
MRLFNARPRSSYKPLRAMQSRIGGGGRGKACIARQCCLNRILGGSAMGRGGVCK